MLNLEKYQGGARAKEIFKTGQQVTIDGNEGVVFLMEK
jgi:phosphohistidine swiveling domain-containing protein